MKCRGQIAETVSCVVKAVMDKKRAINEIREKACHLVPESDRGRFIEIVEIELRALHGGNIARYKLRSAEYEEWQHVWILR
jgi:hypothetical protein